MSPSAELAVAGTILVLCGSALYWVVAPRRGRRESWWLSTETKALLVTVLIMGLILCGSLLLAKGLFA